MSLLGGLVSYNQLLTGHHTGIEPVLLAAAVPARPGARVLEAGSGAGAALLCLAARVENIKGMGVEREPTLAAQARRNATANGYDGLRFVVADIADWAEDPVFDHAMANPPWHEAVGTRSPDKLREAARRANPGGLRVWTARLAGSLRYRGTLSLVLPAALLPEALHALGRADCGSPAVLPLWPHAGEPAKLLLLRAVRGGKSPCRVLPGMVLHEADGSYTAAADAVLRDVAAIDWPA